MPCHHALAEALRAYIDAAGTAEDPRAGSSAPRAGKMAGITAEIGCHLTARNHLGMPSEIKSEWWATSSRIRGRLPPGSALCGVDLVQERLQVLCNGRQGRFPH
jgi:hypothetical protein